jgi:RsmE family RNA methyltransferase
LIVFDKTDKRHEKIDTEQTKLTPSSKSHITGIVGPEGGLTARDYENFAAYTPKVINLGETVLRMETAAIVGAWIIKNNI